MIEKKCWEDWISWVLNFFSSDSERILSRTEVWKSFRKSGTIKQHQKVLFLPFQKEKCVWNTIRSGSLYLFKARWESPFSSLSTSFQILLKSFQITLNVLSLPIKRPFSYLQRPLTYLSKSSERHFFAKRNLWKKAPFMSFSYSGTSGKVFLMQVNRKIS